MRKRLTPLIEKTEGLIRAGEIQKAISILHQIDQGKVALRFCPPLANLFRRCGLFGEAIRFAQRAIRGAKMGDPIHTIALAEYCTVLIRLGSIEEAGRKLVSLRENLEPAVMIARFWYHFTRYEYSESIPLLKLWLYALQDPYLRLVGEINLAEAQFGIRQYENAIEILNDCLQACEASSHFRLLANGLHIRARCWSELNQYKQSDRDLQRALQILKNAKTGDVSLLKRQLAINEARLRSQLQPINKIRIHALEAGLWETLRELDFQSLRIRYKQDVFEKLYFGTPYPAYQQRILFEFPKIEIRDHYNWGPQRGPCLNLSNGELFDYKHGTSKPSAQSLLTLRALLTDRYRPANLRELFSRLYPQEDYHPKSSADRVHQSIARLRAWLSEAKVPLLVNFQNRGYGLEHDGRPSFALRVPLIMPAKFQAKAADSFVECLRYHFKESQIFRAQDVGRLLNLSAATTVRRLSESVKQKKLIRKGAGKRTVYTFAL